MKKTLLFIYVLIMSSTSWAADFENAKDAVTNMGVGWNLGNTLDAANWDGKDGWNFATPEDHETYWGQPITKPELIKMMARQDSIQSEYLSLGSRKWIRTEKSIPSG